MVTCPRDLDGKILQAPLICDLMRTLLPQSLSIAALTLFLMAPLIWVEGTWAADCSAHNYTLRTQADIDALGAEGCDTITGALSIRTYGSSIADVNNVDALTSIISIAGGLTIEHTSLTNVNGLANLESVGGNLAIMDTSFLVDIDGLANLTSVGGVMGLTNNTALTNVDGLANLNSVFNYLTIAGNSSLANLEGLANLANVAHLYIYDNPQLMNLDGLNGLSSVGGIVEIYRNESLSDINGLENVTSVGWDFTIEDNPALAHLNGLTNLEQIGGHLKIVRNDSLANLDGLASLTTVDDEMSIEFNAVLAHLDGLSSLDSVGGYLVIYNNASLRDVDGLLSLTSVGGFFTIGGGPITSLSGISSLTSVEGNLSLSYMDSLAAVDGFNSLMSIGGWLWINNLSSATGVDGFTSLTSISGQLAVGTNDSLSHLDGFAKLTSAGQLNISSNAALTNCQGVAPLLGWPNGPPDDAVDGDLYIFSNSSGCNSEQEVISSVSGPTQPSINQATPSGSSFDIGFTLSTTTDTAFPISGYNATCVGSDIDVSDSPGTELLDNTPVQEVLTVSGYDPTSVLSFIEVDIDITHSDPTDLYITLTTPEGTELVLWNQGSTGGEDLVGTFPTTLTSIDSLDSVTRQTIDGDWTLSIEDIDVGPLVREGVLNSWGLRITEELSRNGSSSPIEVLGATRGRDYTCTVAPITQLGTGPVSAPYTLSVPLETPAVPSITSTDYEDGEIILTVSVSDNGGANITRYDATCTDGTNTYTGTSTSSPVIVSGLTNGVAYTCTVTATNSANLTSAPSATTAPIIPEELIPGLPIWLLYQATQ